jgi:hypothetical protein
LARRERTEMWGLLMVGAAGVLLIALGVLALDAGTATHAFVNYRGQQQIPGFAIPTGITFVAIPMVILAIRGWRRWQVRRISRRYER